MVVLLCVCVGAATLWNGPTRCSPAYDLKLCSTISLIISRGCWVVADCEMVCAAMVAIACQLARYLCVMIYNPLWCWI